MSCVMSELAHTRRWLQSLRLQWSRGRKVLQGSVLAEPVSQVEAGAALLDGMQELGEDGFLCPL